MSLMIKICGMREPENIHEVANLMPDLMGFIFYPFSPRYVAGTFNPEIFENFPPGIIKTGVFVNEDANMIKQIVRKYSLDMVQLHGDESPDTCRMLSEEGIHIIKSFRIKNRIEFNNIANYIPYTNYFLFDTAARKYGGSGHKFDWDILANYALDHPFFLSGGISPEDVYKIAEITNPSFCGLDLNSRFELKPGLKDVEVLKKFVFEVRNKKVK